MIFKLKDGREVENVEIQFEKTPEESFICQADFKEKSKFFPDIILTCCEQELEELTEKYPEWIYEQWHEKLRLKANTFKED